MSLALYRKYRPGSFAQVVGQSHVTGPLRQALANGRAAIEMGLVAEAKRSLDPDEIDLDEDPGFEPHPRPGGPADRPGGPGLLPRGQFLFLTGASGGIGAALCDELVAAGATDLVGGQS